MRIDVIDSSAGLAELQANWETLYDADPEAQFFLSWTWMSKWLRSIDKPWFVLAAKPVGSSSYAGLLPLWLGTREHKAGGFYNDVNMGGNYVSDYTGFLCAPEFVDQAIPAFAARIKQLHWTNLRIEELRASDHRTTLFMRQFSDREFKFRDVNCVNSDNIDNSICPAAPLPGDWNAYLEKNLSANMRQKLRRLLRQIEKSGEFRITHSETDTFERDLETLLRFWTARWGRRKGQRLNGILRNNRLMLRHAFGAGALYLPVLWQGDRPVGALAIFVDPRKKSFLFHMAGRDETFDGPQPGLILHAHSIRRAISNGFATYDFMRGNEAYKYSFGVEEHRNKSVIVTTKSGKNLGGRLDGRSLAFALERSKEHHRAGRHAKAEPGFRQIIDIEPRNADALYCLGQVLAKRGKHAAAIGMFKTLLADHPEVYKAWVRLGRSLTANGQLAEAVDALFEAIRREPKKADAYHALGHALVDLGLFDQAVATFDAVRDLQPDYPGIGASLMEAVRLRGGLSRKELTRRAALHADLRDKVGKLSVIAAALNRSGPATTKPPVPTSKATGAEPLLPLQPAPASVGLLGQRAPAANAEEGLQLYNAAIAGFLPQGKR
ncbi:MAG TPA: GNAT family N-acetyltransferase [Bradyrhizobium sp.]|nr:GNAT family N-acetyltransferase [Bradyrhizobium sp.]